MKNLGEFSHIDTTAVRKLVSLADGDISRLQLVQFMTPDRMARILSCSYLNEKNQRKIIKGGDITVRQIVDQFERDISGFA